MKNLNIKLWTALRHARANGGQLSRRKWMLTSLPKVMIVQHHRHFLLKEIKLW
jgi:hypothetical protein